MLMSLQVFELMYLGVIGGSRVDKPVSWYVLQPCIWEERLSCVGITKITSPLSIYGDIQSQGCFFIFVPYRAYRGVLILFFVYHKDSKLLTIHRSIIVKAIS